MAESRRFRPPQAQAFLAKKLKAGEDGGGHWSNIPIAIKMLECASSQGLGSAAYELAFLYPAIRSEDGTIVGAPTRETKERALRILHEGVKFGCADCANKLSIEFDRPLDLSRMLAPHIDKARGARYDMLGDALWFNSSRRLPNLDKILPLPPAELPPWDGKRESLLAAAMGVSFAPEAHVTSAATPAQQRSRHSLDPAYTLRTTGQRTDQSRAPFAGYWRPNVEEGHGLSKQQLERILPGLYQTGELFDPLPIPRIQGPSVPRVAWEHFRTVRSGYPDVVDPQAVAGLTRVVPREDERISCRAGSVCPVSGIWQPWVAADHPLQGTVNQTWRQTWSVAGQAFPDPQRDWLLNLSASDVTWHLMERSKEN